MATICGAQISAMPGMFRLTPTAPVAAAALIFFRFQGIIHDRNGIKVSFGSGPERFG